MLAAFSPAYRLTFAMGARWFLSPACFFKMPDALSMRVKFLLKGNKIHLEYLKVKSIFAP